MFLAVLIGTMLVIPTAGEIPILLGHFRSGVGTGVLGALLTTLPAVSLPSMAMVDRVTSVKVTVVVAAAVAATEVVSAALSVGFASLRADLMIVPWLVRKRGPGSNCWG